MLSAPGAASRERRCHISAFRPWRGQQGASLPHLLLRLLARPALIVQQRLALLNAALLSPAVVATLPPLKAAKVQLPRELLIQAPPLVILTAPTRRAALAAGQLCQRAAQVRQLLAPTLTAAAALALVWQRKLGASQLFEPLLLEAQQRLLLGCQALVVLYRVGGRGAGAEAGTLGAARRSGVRGAFGEARWQQLLQPRSRLPADSKLTTKPPVNEGVRLAQLLVLHK